MVKGNDTQKIFKKILYIVPDVFSVGGIAKYNQSFLEVLLSKREYLVKVISRNDVLNGVNNISVISFGKVKNVILRKIFFTLRVIWEVVFSNPDLIICAHINFSLLTFFLKKILNKKYLILTYGIEVQNINRLKILSLRNSERIIAISDYTKQKLLSYLSNSDKIFLLYPTVDSDKFKIKSPSQELIQKYCLNGFKVLLTIARLSSSERYKGYDRVIEVLPKVLEKIPNTKYLLVGKGDDVVRLKELVFKRGLAEKVIFVGFVPEKELVDYYNLCDVFIMPSKYEGFGIVFIEALACGKPVIAGDRDASKEAILNGELGILVNPDDKDEIVQAIIRMLKKNVPKKLLDREYLREKVICVYGKDVFKKKVQILLNEILG